MAIPQYMILDNNKISSKKIYNILKDISECSCQIFHSPSQLLIAIKDNRPDVIFCNVSEKDCDPRDLINDIDVHVDVDIPLVFISDLLKSEERRQCFLDTGYSYLTYPLNVKMIQEALQLAFAEKR